MSEHSAAVAHPHPALSQLAALHHFRTYVDVGVVVVVLAITNLIAHFTTPWANIACGAGCRRRAGRAGAFPRSGLGRTRLGREHWRSGLVSCAGRGGPWCSAVIAVGALLPWTRPMFLNNHYATLSGALVASMIIPLQTVIPEELAFRGGAARRPGPGLGLPGWPPQAHCCSGCGISPAHWA